MSLGTLMTSAKKFSNASDEEIIVSENFKENLKEKTKGESINVGNLKGYKLLGVVDKDKHSTFISGFLARQEKEKRLAEEKAKKEKANVAKNDSDEILS